jgi:signal recognition particle subunit SRP54
MFETLQEKLQTVFDRLSTRGKLSESDVDAALREVRLALLEADVHYKVAKDFISRVRERAVGTEVTKSLTPAQQVIKIVHQELIATLGEAARLNLDEPSPRVIMLVGLQGSGKTTTAAKLALQLKQHNYRPLLVAADIRRPAAIEQLKVLGRELDITVFSEDTTVLPPQICADAIKYARTGAYGVVILDTAGRLQIDDELMQELEEIKKLTSPREILLVADAMTGQEAVNVASGFHQRVGLTGLILTKIDGDARGGAAISIRAVTGVPIKYLGTGEKTKELEPFHPDRMASRILGMGDMLSLIERAEAEIDQGKARQTGERLLKGDFDFEDFLNQLHEVKKLGPIQQVLGMIPGLGKLSKNISEEDADKQLRISEAIINSMTVIERRNPKLLNASRKRRISKGSGTTVQDVNGLMRQYMEMQRMMKMLRKGGGKRGLSNLLGGF